MYAVICGPTTPPAAQAVSTTPYITVILPAPNNSDMVAGMVPKPPP